MRASDVGAATVAFIICLTMSPIVGAVCNHLRILDHPGLLKIHTRPIPRLGGVAIAVAIAAGMLVAGHFELHLSLVVTAFSLVWFTGLLDDIQSLPPSVRLIAQIAAAFLLWRAGCGFPNVLGEISSLIVTGDRRHRFSEFLEFRRWCGRLGRGACRNLRARVLSCVRWHAKPCNNYACGQCRGHVRRLSHLEFRSSETIHGRCREHPARVQHRLFHA